MGTVHLTNNHHGLYLRNKDLDLEKHARVLLDAELLARPILTSAATGGVEEKDYLQRVTRAALQALMELGDFNAAVSYCVVEVEGIPHIVRPHRVWGEITTGTPDNIVVGFSHDSRHENRPYRNLLHWLDARQPEEYLSEKEYQKFAEEWSTPLPWWKLFHERIYQRAESLHIESSELLKNADVITSQARAIQAALGSLEP